MQTNGKKTMLSAVIMAVTLSGNSWAVEVEPLQQRVDRLERIIQGQGLMNLITRVDQLQDEVKRLNGENETLRHEMEKMQEQQREMYLDLEERLTPEVQAVPSAPVEMPTNQNSEMLPPVELEMTVINTPEDTNGSESVMTSDENGEVAYREAFQLLRSGEYEEAIAIFEKFPEQYPGSIYLPNVYYWHGEAKYVLREFADAVALFQIVIIRYPFSNKLPDALLKRGFSEYEMGNVQLAVATLNQVIQEYPNSSVANLAQARLDRINPPQ